MSELDNNPFNIIDTKSDAIKIANNDHKTKEEIVSYVKELLNNSIQIFYGYDVNNPKTQHKYFFSRYKNSDKFILESVADPNNIIIISQEKFNAWYEHSLLITINDKFDIVDYVNKHIFPAYSLHYGRYIFGIERTYSNESEGLKFKRNLYAGTSNFIKHMDFSNHFNLTLYRDGSQGIDKVSLLNKEPKFGSVTIYYNLDGDITLPYGSIDLSKYHPTSCLSLSTITENSTRGLNKFLRKLLGTKDIVNWLIKEDETINIFTDDFLIQLTEETISVIPKRTGNEYYLYGKENESTTNYASPATSIDYICEYINKNRKILIKKLLMFDGN